MCCMRGQLIDGASSRVGGKRREPQLMLGSIDPLVSQRFIPTSMENLTMGPSWTNKIQGGGVVWLVGWFF